ncbi:MAG TPA: hypothetical protein PL117_15460 [Accumulibacter sp.]|uniref:hypothetical protein n=1 Tax=Accumulibacter sp. TaxID=2053492 RepID=UPI002BA89FBE|nr:hypothetical protein [Accumulibacter sp.]HRF74166.1 hypothetical protein [Accumulibacter sp.]
MDKLDPSCGLTANQIGAIKFKIKQAINQKLPVLPEHEELKLFFQGRSAYTYSWRLLEQNTVDRLHRIHIEVDVKLKKEFCHYPQPARHTFSCRLELQAEICQSVKSIREVSARR